MIEDLFETRDLLNQSFREIRGTKEANELQETITQLNKSIDKLNRENMEKTVGEMDELYKQLDETKQSIKQSLNEIKKTNNRTAFATDILKNAQNAVSIILQII